MTGLIYIGDDLWLRPEEIGGVDIRWSEYSLGSGTVLVLANGEWLTATRRIEVMEQAAGRLARIIADLSNNNQGDTQ